MSSYLEHRPLPRSMTTTPSRAGNVYWGAVTNDRMPNRIILPIDEAHEYILNHAHYLSPEDVFRMYEQIFEFLMELNTLDPPNPPRLNVDHLVYGRHTKTQKDIEELHEVFRNVFACVRAAMIMHSFRDLVAADGAFSYYISDVRNGGNVMILDYMPL